MVKGIDLQHALAKTLETERVQEIGKQQLESAQRQFARELQNHAAHKLHTTQDAQESEEAKIRDEEKEKQRRRKARKEKESGRGDNAPPEDEIDDDGCGKIIDIKV